MLRTFRENRIFLHFVEAQFEWFLTSVRCHAELSRLSRGSMREVPAAAREIPRPACESAGLRDDAEPPDIHSSFFIFRKVR
jgi:hypothetical protein